MAKEAFGAKSWWCWLWLAAALCMAACGGDGDGDSSPGGGGGGGGGGGDGDSYGHCVSQYQCVNGLCSCPQSGASCCDPGLCGADNPQSCERVCNSCSCQGDECGGGSEDPPDHPVDEPPAPIDPGCGASSCWDACNADHGTCAERCGSGCACWAACNSDHGTCTERCGPGPECWDHCNSDHGTCAERCGPGPECWDHCNSDHGTCAERCGS